MASVTDVAGYTFEGEFVTAHGIKVLFGAEHADYDTEALLDSIARERGIDRSDDASFDSWSFPQVALHSQIEAGETFFDGYDDRHLPLYVSSTEL